MKALFLLKLFWTKQSRKIFFFATISLLVIGFSVSYVNLKHQIGNNPRRFINSKDIKELIDQKYLFEISLNENPQQKLYEITFSQPHLKKVDFIEILKIFADNLSQTKLQKLIIKRLTTWIKWIQHTIQRLTILSRLVLTSSSNHLIQLKNNASLKGYVELMKKQPAYLFFQAEINFLKWFFVRLLADVNSLSIEKTRSTIVEFNKNLSEMVKKNPPIKHKKENVFYI